jgi:uncharacterized protein YhbP (UPF0306 family)
MTISVCDHKGNPWIANLFFVCDEQYNFYWYSRRSSRHSKIIRENELIAISIFDSRAIGEDVDGIYVQSKAYEIGDISEVKKATKLYAIKAFTEEQSKIDFINSYIDFVGKSPLRMYRATPLNIYKLADSGIYNKKYLDFKVRLKL